MDAASIMSQIRLYNDVLRPWRVTLIRQGDRYGLNDCCVHDKPEAMVEFWDTAHDHIGQFVARYYVSTIMESAQGITLHAGVRAWSVDAGVVEQVQRWLQAEEVL